jgi:hypothetical protein
MLSHATRWYAKAFPHPYEKLREGSMKKLPPYENLPFLPAMIAETVCGEEYTEQEWSEGLRDKERANKVEIKRQAMTPEQVEAFAAYVDERCKIAYELKADYFMKIVNAKGNRGLDQLYVYVRHWLVSWLSLKPENKKYVITGLVKTRDVFEAPNAEAGVAFFRAKYMATIDKESSILSVELLEDFRKNNPKSPINL